MIEVTIREYQVNYIDILQCLCILFVLIKGSDNRMTTKEKTITLNLHRDSVFYGHHKTPLRLLASFEDTKQDLHHNVVVYRHSQLGFGATTLNNVVKTETSNNERKEMPISVSQYIGENPGIIGSTRIVSAAPASIYHPLDKEEVTIVNVTSDPNERNPVPLLVFFHSQHGYGALYHYGLKEV